MSERISYKVTLYEPHGPTRAWLDSRMAVDAYLAAWQKPQRAPYTIHQIDRGNGAETLIERVTI